MNKSNTSLTALLEKVKARQNQLNQSQTETCETLEQDKPVVTNQYGDAISYNEEQQSFIDIVSSGKSAVLIGAAGTGKTTVQKGAVNSLLQSGLIPNISDTLGHKYLSLNTPGIILTSFTRRAVRNLKRAMSTDLQNNCITIHKLLEYQPVPYEVYDEETDKYKTTIKFEPTRNIQNPLPNTIKTIVFDESSMISTDLFTQLCDALPHSVQFIFVGDIQQLPPVFGAAILGFKLLELPVVELTQVYRQALESPIISLATDIRNGIPTPTFTERIIREHPTQGKLTLHPWKKKLHPDVALLTVAKFFTSALDSGAYNPFEDQILIPFNKSLGTIELNKHIANHIAKTNQKPVYEIVAGYNKHYFSVGDLVLFDKEDAVIREIKKNGTYLGKAAKKHSVTLDYWGFNPMQNGTDDLESFDPDSIDAFLEAASSISDEKVNQSSHIIELEMIDSGTFVTIDTASEVNSLILSYALTVHKSQGSEWDRVFVVFHQSHNTMIQRELLYTAITRAKHELYVICEPDTFERGVTNQKIKGTTLAEKAEYFKGKLQNNV